MEFSTNNNLVAYLGSGNLFGRIVTTFLKQFPSVLRLNIYGCSDQITSEDCRGHCKVQQFWGKEQLPHALEGVDIVVIGDESNTVEPSRECVLNIASKVFDYAYVTGSISPKAMVVVSASPLNLMLPLMGHVLQDLGCFDGRKLLGVTSEETLRANPLFAEFTGVDEAILPVVGGASPQTRVPLFSQAKPQVQLKEEDKHKLIEDIKGFDLIYSREEIVTERAYATIRLLRLLIQGLENSQNPVTEMAMTKTSLVADTTYFSLPVELGQAGVQRAFGLPVLQGIEEELLEYAVVNLNHDLTRAFDIFKGLKPNLEAVSNDSMIARRKYVNEDAQELDAEDLFHALKNETFIDLEKNSKKSENEQLRNSKTTIQAIEKPDDTMSKVKLISDKIKIDKINYTNLNTIETGVKHHLKGLKQFPIKNERGLKNKDEEFYNKFKSTKMINESSRKNYENFTTVENENFNQSLFKNKESTPEKDTDKNMKYKLNTNYNAPLKSVHLNERKNNESTFFEQEGDTFLIKSSGESTENLSMNKELNKTNTDGKIGIIEKLAVLNNKPLEENERFNQQETIDNQVNLNPGLVKSETHHSPQPRRDDNLTATSVAFSNSIESNSDSTKSNQNHNKNAHQNGYDTKEKVQCGSLNNASRLTHETQSDCSPSEVIQQISLEKSEGKFNLFQSGQECGTEDFLKKKENYVRLTKECFLNEKEDGELKKLPTTDQISALIFDELSQKNNEEKENTVLPEQNFNHIDQINSLSIEQPPQPIFVKEHNELINKKELDTRKSLNKIEKTYAKAEDNNANSTEIDHTMQLNNNCPNKISNDHHQNDSLVDEKSSSQETRNQNIKIGTNQNLKIDNGITSIEWNQPKENLDPKLVKSNVNSIIQAMYCEVNKVLSEQVENVQKVVIGLMKGQFENQNSDFNQKSNFKKTNREGLNKKTVPTDHQEKGCREITKTNAETFRKEIIDKNINHKVCDNASTSKFNLPLKTLERKTNCPTLNILNKKALKTIDYRRGNDILKHINKLVSKDDNIKINGHKNACNIQPQTRKQLEITLNHSNRNDILKTHDLNEKIFKKVNISVMSNINANYERKSNEMLGRQMLSKIKIPDLKNTNNREFPQELSKERNYKVQNVTTTENEVELTKNGKSKNTIGEKIFWQSMTKSKTFNIKNDALSPMKNNDAIELGISNDIKNVEENNLTKLKSTSKNNFQQKAPQYKNIPDDVKQNHRDYFGQMMPGLSKEQNIVNKKESNPQGLLFKEEREPKRKEIAKTITSEIDFPKESKTYENKQHEKLLCENESKQNDSKKNFHKTKIENEKNKESYELKKTHENDNIKNNLLSQGNNRVSVSKETTKEQNVLLEEKKMFNVYEKKHVNKLQEIKFPTIIKIKPSVIRTTEDRGSGQSMTQSKKTVNKLGSCDLVKEIMNSEQDEKVKEAKMKLKLAIMCNAPQKSSLNKGKQNIISIQSSKKIVLNHEYELKKNQNESVSNCYDQKIEKEAVQTVNFSSDKASDRNIAKENLRRQNEILGTKDYKKYEKHVDQCAGSKCIMADETIKNSTGKSNKYLENKKPLAVDLIANNEQKVAQGKMLASDQINEKTPSGNSFKKEYPSSDLINKELCLLNKPVIEDRAIQFEAEQKDIENKISKINENVDQIENLKKKHSGLIIDEVKNNVKSEEPKQMNISKQHPTQEFRDTGTNSVNSPLVDGLSGKDTKEVINKIKVLSLSNTTNKSIPIKNLHKELSESSKRTPNFTINFNEHNKKFMKRYTILKKGGVSNMIKEDINAEECKAMIYEQYSRKNTNIIRHSDKGNSPVIRKMESSVRKGPSIIFERISKKSQSSKTTEKIVGIRRSHNLSLVSVNQENKLETTHPEKNESKNPMNMKQNINFLQAAKHKLYLTKMIHQNKKINIKQCSIKKHFRDISPEKININKNNISNPEQLIQKSNELTTKLSTNNFSSVKNTRTLGTKTMTEAVRMNKVTENVMNMTNDNGPTSSNSNNLIDDTLKNLKFEEPEKDTNSESPRKLTVKPSSRSKTDQIDNSKTLQISKDNWTSLKNKEGSMFVNEITQSRANTETRSTPKKNEKENAQRLDSKKIISTNKKEPEQNRTPKLKMDTGKKKRKQTNEKDTKNNIRTSQKLDKIGTGTKELKPHNATASVVKNYRFSKMDLATGNKIPPKSTKNNSKYLKPNSARASINSLIKKHNPNLSVSKDGEGKNNYQSKLKYYSKNDNMVPLCVSNSQKLNFGEKENSISTTKLVKMKSNYLLWSPKSLKTKKTLEKLKLNDPDKKHGQMLLSNNNNVNSSGKTKMTADAFKEYMYKNRSIKSNNSHQYFITSGEKTSDFKPQDICYNYLKENSENIGSQLSAKTFVQAESKFHINKFKNKSVLESANTNRNNNKTSSESKATCMAENNEDNKKKTNINLVKSETRSKYIKNIFHKDGIPKKYKGSHSRASKMNGLEKISQYTPSARIFLDLSPAKVITPYAQERDQVQPKKIHLLKAYQDEAHSSKNQKRSVKMNIKYKPEADMLENNKSFFDLHNPIALLRKESLGSVKLNPKLPSSKAEKHLPHSSSLKLIKQNDLTLSNSRASPERGNLKKQLSRLFNMFQSVIKN